MLIKKIKNTLFISKIKEISKIYFLPFLLSLWGIGNVLYWEVYKGYKACTFCKWHRGLYFSLFIALLLLYKFRRNIFKVLIFLIIGIEIIVGTMQVFGLACNPMICRRVSLPEKFNFAFAVISLSLTLLFELYYWLKAKKIICSK